MMWSSVYERRVQKSVCTVSAVEVRFHPNERTCDLHLTVGANTFHLFNGSVSCLDEFTM